MAIICIHFDELVISIGVFISVDVDVFGKIARSIWYSGFFLFLFIRVWFYQYISIV